MAAWSAFYPLVLPYVRGAAEPVMDAALLASAAEFLRRTKAWQAWLSPVTITANQRQYSFALPTDASLVRMVRATLDGLPLDLAAYFDQLADPALFAGDGPAASTPDRLTLSTLAQLPAGAKLQVQAVLTCSDSATSVPDWIASQYREPIALGARARLKQQPAREFTDLNGAVLDAQRFEAAIGSTQAQVYQGHTSQTPRKRPNWF